MGKKFAGFAGLLAASLLFGTAGSACAQALPVAVNVAGNVATVVVGPASNPVADLTLSFDSVSGLSAANLGISAEVVDIRDPTLLSRLPGSAQTALSSGFPVMITVEPPVDGGLLQRRVTHVEIHTHGLTYASGSPLRLFKAQLGGSFRDITESVAPGSVRTRGTTPGWSQFVIVADLRPTSSVIAEKFSYLRTQLGYLSTVEAAPLLNYLSLAEQAVAQSRFDDAAVALDGFSARVASRAGAQIPDVWRSARDQRNIAGELLSGANTLGFSIGYLRDYGI